MNASLHGKVHYLQLMAAQAANQHRPHGGVEAVDELPSAWKQRNSEPFHHWYVVMLREILAHAARGDALAIALAREIGDYLEAYVIFLKRLRENRVDDGALMRVVVSKINIETVAEVGIYAWVAYKYNETASVNPWKSFRALYDLGWLLGVVDNRYDIRGR